MSELKTINWNHLGITIPASWETIVKAPRHLIFEQDLAPFLEIRWQHAGKYPSPKHIEAIVKQVDHRAVPSTGSQYPQQSPRQMVEGLATHFDTTVLETNSDGVTALLLTCKTCGTTILIGLHRKSFECSDNNRSVLTSLQCGHGNNDAGRWQIHDFFFFIPDGFEIESFSFQFGISNLLFKYKRADLRICKLAPASEHLMQNDFTALFASFCNAPRESMQVVDARTLRYQTSPVLLDQLWQRVRRKRPFTHASFRHFPGSDRILGYLLTANTSPAPELETQLENGYGIIQKKAAETTTDP